MGILYLSGQDLSGQEENASAVDEEQNMCATSGRQNTSIIEDRAIYHHSHTRQQIEQTIAGMLDALRLQAPD